MKRNERNIQRSEFLAGSVIIIKAIKNPKLMNSHTSLDFVLKICPPNVFSSLKNAFYLII